MEKRALKIYFAGDLFDAKDLGGNLLLASAIEKISQDRYKVMLPQNGESEVVNRSAQSIRDEDFRLLLSCDLIVANFDGTDLDSGTVVEFCFAKMLDMPAVLLRTDFRNAGDSELPDTVPWNLMCSHYPRTEVVHINGMMRYHECMAKELCFEEMLNAYYSSIAADVAAAMDRVVSKKSWLAADELLAQYRRTVKSVGGSLDQLLPDDLLTALTESKIAAGLYS